MMKLKKGFAVAMAAGVLTTGGLGVQASVFSATAIAADQGQAVDLTKMPEKATLKIHKYEKPNWDGSQYPNNGKALTAPTGAVALQGAKFKIQKIEGVDLSTNEGWQLAEKLSKTFKTDAPADETAAKASLQKEAKVTGFGNAIEKTTDSDGLAATDPLARGLYLVVETEAPAEHKLSVKPFVVALPLTNPDKTSEWLSEVNVYPKNQKDEENASKTVEDYFKKGDGTADLTKGLINGQNIEYTLSQPLVDGDPYTGMVLVDHFPTDRLVSQDATVPAEVKVGTVGLTKDTHYTETVENGQYKIEFKKAGLDKINEQIAAKPAVSVSVKMTFQVKDEQSAGPIINSYNTWTSRDKVPPTQTTVTPPPPGTTDSPFDPPTTPPTDAPKSYYGSVDIQKKDADGADLTGAKFELYECTSAADLATKLKANPAPTPLKSEFEANGEVEIKGLLANDFRNNADVPEGDRTKYCLVETKAPANHELLAAPVEFSLSKDTPALSLTLPVVNTKENGGFDLPLTGGKGVFALLLAGAAFLVLGRGYSVYAGRRKDA